MEVATATAAIKQRWLIVAIITVIFAAAAGAVTMLSPPKYSATAEGVVSVGTPQNRPPYALANGSRYILDRMTSYAQLGVTAPVLDPVSEELDVQEPLRDRVSAQSVANQAVLRVTVEDGDPAASARLADAVMRQLSKTVESLEHGNVVVSQVTPASVPSDPANRKLALNMAVGAAAGLVVGLFAAVGLGMMSGRRAERQVIEHAGR